VNKSHNVTVFTPFTDGHSENYTEVDISKGHMKFLDMDIKEMRLNVFTVMDLLVETSRMQCDLVYENSKMKKVLDSKNTDFDLVIIENFAIDCISYIATKLNLPLIYVTPMPTIVFMERSSTGYLKSINGHTYIFFACHSKNFHPKINQYVFVYLLQNCARIQRTSSEIYRSEKILFNQTYLTIIDIRK